MNKSILAIDVETYCDLDISEVGAYKYCQDPSFKILLFGYAFDDEPVQVIDLTEEITLPDRVIDALMNPNITKTAFNANFERNAIANEFALIECPPEQWDCTMIRALRLGLPGSLDMVGKALNFAEDKQKMKEGKDLIRYFCKPCKRTKAEKNQMSFLGELPNRHTPSEAPEKWEVFKQYNKQDVEVERDIRKKLSRYETTDFEKKLWFIDQHINDRGVGIDEVLADKAIQCDEQFKEICMKEAAELTGLDNPNSPTQIKKWIGNIVGHEITSLTKDSIPGLIAEAKDERVKRMLELRQLMSKTSTKKYQTMLAAQCKDKRAHGLLQFYGANRTGRWAGRLVQVQNLPQNHLPDLDNARKLLREGKFDELEFLFDSIPDTLSQLIRTAFIPKKGNRFIVADFSAIEARVIAYLAGEQWRLDVFKDGGDIYCASASKMFKVPVEKHGINGHLRQKGKIAELALGYGGAGGAVRAFDKAGSIPDEELPKIVSDWRKASPHIVNFWWDVDKAAKKAINGRTTVSLHHGIRFTYEPGVLFIVLPSGRRLSYIRPKIEPGPYDKNIITYEGMEQTKHTWTRIETYGPKLVENIVQAFARDCLGMVMSRVEERGHHVVMHVHDELIIDEPIGSSSVEEMCAVFAEPIEWAPGILLKADGYECNYYMKD